MLATTLLLGVYSLVMACGDSSDSDSWDEFAPGPSVIRVMLSSSVVLAWEIDSVYRRRILGALGSLQDCTGEIIEIIGNDNRVLHRIDA